MKIQFKIFSVGLLIMSLAVVSELIYAPSLVRADEKGLLDQKTFTGEMGEVGQKKGDPDKFIFANGQFRSEACDAYGFSSAGYKAETKGDIIAFESETTSPTDGKMRWKGTVQGDTLQGTAIWMKNGKELGEHWFRGTMKESSDKTMEGSHSVPEGAHMEEGSHMPEGSH